MCTKGYKPVPTLTVDERDPSPTRQWGRQVSGKSSTAMRQGHKDREDRRRERLNSELLIAVLQSDKEQVERLLNDGASPEASCRASMCSTVHLAALRGEVTILKTLLEAGANTDTRDLSGRQAVHFACYSGYVKTLQVLLEANGDLLNSAVVKPKEAYVRLEQEDSWDHNHEEISTMLPPITLGSTPLHIACKLSKVNVVQYLLELGANVNLKDGQGLTPLDVAGLQGAGKPSCTAMGKLPNHMIYSYNDQKRSKQSEERLYPKLEDLWNHGSYFNQENFSSKANSVNDFYISPGRPISTVVPPSILKDERMSPISDLEQRSTKPLYDIVNALLNSGAKMNEEEENEFMEGTRFKHCLCVTALHTAVVNEDLNLIDLLLENGANLIILDEKGESPLHLAVRKKLYKPLETMISWLELELIDIKNNEGLTSLHQAVIEEWANGIGLLLEAGADVRIFSDKTNETVLHLAAKSGNPKLLEELLTIDNALEVIDSCDKEGFTPLFRAIEKECLENIEILLEYGANIEIMLPGDINILHYVAQSKSIDILNVILNNKETCHHLINRLCDEKRGGFAPIHFAAKKGREDCVELLLNFGANVDLITTVEPYNSTTALHLAAQRGYSRTVRTILARHPNTLKNKDVHNWTPLHVAACYGHGECVVIMLHYGANMADKVTYHGVKRTALDLIVLNVPKPIDLLEDLLDSYITSQYCSVKYANCAIELNYEILLGPTVSDPIEEKQLIFLNTILNNGNPLLKERLLLHPLVESFLFYKWMNVRTIFIMLLIFYTIHTVALTIFSVLTFVHKIDMSRAWSCSILLAALVPIIITEILHALPFKRYYFSDSESWIKWALISTSIITVTVDPAVPETRHIACLSVLLSWTEILFLLARFPAWGLHVLMFEKVAANIFQVLTRFAFLFVGFMFAFMIHFEGAPPFGNIWEAICKVLVMVVELDYSATFDDSGNVVLSSMIGRIMYVCFILLVATAMTNLMVGMAVSDVAVLENQGRTQRLAKQTAFLTFLELCVYNDLFLKCLPIRIQNFVKKSRSVSPHVRVHPNRSTETLPPELRATLLDKAINFETEEEAVTLAHQSAKLEGLEKKINDISSQINCVYHAIQSSNNPFGQSVHSNV